MPFAPKTNARSLPRRLWWRLAWVRCFAVFALLFAAPATQQIAAQVAVLITDDASGCTDHCQGCGCCLGSCQACHCCSHPNTLAPPLFAVPNLVTTSEFIGLELEELHPTEYVSPPFRPPMV